MPNNDAAIVYLSDVDNFPTTKRESKNKLLTENSLTRLINRLLNVDSFIITDSIRVDSGSTGSRGNLLDINSNVLLSAIDFEDDKLEFMIRGYYFSVDVGDLKEAVAWDTYVTQHAPASKTTTNIPFALYARIFIDKTTQDYPELLGQGSPEGTPATYKGVQFFISPINDKPSPSHPSIPTDPVSGTPIGLGTNYLYYDLMLFEYIDNDFSVPMGTYLPFESLCKFGTHSQKYIDGGEIILSNN